MVLKCAKVWTQLWTKVWAETKTVYSKKLQIATKENQNKQITKTAQNKKTKQKKKQNEKKNEACEETSKNKLIRTALNAD